MNEVLTLRSRLNEINVSMSLSPSLSLSISTYLSLSLPQADIDLAAQSAIPRLKHQQSPGSRVSRFQETHAQTGKL